MDTQGEKNGDTADTHTKKRTGRDKIKDKTKQINIQNKQPERQGTPQKGLDPAASMGFESS